MRSADSCPKADSPPESQRARRREGATCRDSAVSSDGRLEMGRRWSDQRHLNQVQLVFGSSAGVPHFFQASSGNCGSLCYGYSLLIR